ncbi:MAG: DUF4102 domain-containing protein, partial [Pseudolabrys sp.]|nr:DUF4102 domain-containing protein [Pseudolabrys sp.]
MALTKKRIEKLKQRGRYCDGHGLYLQFFSHTNRGWVFRFSRNGREHWMGLGALHTVNLDDARELARTARKQLLEGLDPIEERRRQKAAKRAAAARTITFEDAAQSYFDQKSPAW